MSFLIHKKYLYGYELEQFSSAYYFYYPPVDGYAIRIPEYYYATVYEKNPDYFLINTKKDNYVFTAFKYIKTEEEQLLKFKGIKVSEEELKKIYEDDYSRNHNIDLN